jgi:curved DNA-binding protein CbpA
MKTDYYKVLGIERTASENEIRQRFRQLAREYHPDRFSGKDKVQAERTFQTLTEAVNVLTNPDRRRQHDAGMGSSDKPADDLRQVAKTYLAKGIKAYNEADFGTAREHFDMAAKHDPNDAKAHHYLALASARNPATIRQAVQAIERAVTIEPYNQVYLKLAGLLCRRAGLPSKAERYLEEAVRWDQDDPEIRAALDELRKGRGDAKGGLLDSLFKKS